MIRSFAAIAAKLFFATFATLASHATAQAQVLTFVSNTGVDTRPCTVQAQPCKTLQRAVNVTAAGGTVRILSDLVSPATTIAKSLNVEGGGNSVSVAIAINGASAIVTLNGLHLTGRGALLHGIRIDSAAAVHIEDCRVERYTSDGITFNGTAATKLFVSNTAVSANGSDGLHAEALNAQVVIENSRFDGNSNTGLFLKVAKGNVTRSAASGNSSNGVVLRAGRHRITETTADDNGGNGFSLTAGIGFTVLDAASTNGNVGPGLNVEVTVTALITHCVFMGSGAIPGVDNQGTLSGATNNSIDGRSGNPLNTYPQQ